MLAVQFERNVDCAGCDRASGREGSRWGLSRVGVVPRGAAGGLGVCGLHHTVARRRPGREDACEGENTCFESAQCGSRMMAAALVVNTL